MTKEQEETKKQYEYLDSRGAQAADALVALKNFPKKDRNEKSLNKILNESNKEAAKIQKNCTHEMYYAGHGHNDDCYECVICGHTEWS